MAVHNAGRYLEPAIESVERQTYRSWELVVIDDCSTDGAIEQLARDWDDRVQLFRNETNLGAAGSRNVALEHARGQYIAIQDADDVARPDRLQLSMAVFESYPETCVAFGDHEIIDANDSVLGRSHAPATHEGAALRLRETMPFGHSTVVARRACVTEHGRYDTSYEPAEDYKLFASMLLGGCRFRSVDAVVLGYRDHELGISKTRVTKLRQARTLVSRRVRESPVSGSADEWSDVLRREPSGPDFQPRIGVVKDLFKETRQVNGPPLGAVMKASSKAGGFQLMRRIACDVVASAIRRTMRFGQRGTVTS